MSQTAIFRSRREELAALRREMAEAGASNRRIAATIQRRLKVNSRAAFRHTYGLTQQQVADRWNELWPSHRPLTYKQVSYWEAWPRTSGRERR